MYFPEIKDEAKFLDITYLSNGNLRQQAAYKTLTETGIMESLAAFSPVLAGTIPIDIDIPDSDLDILCDMTSVDPREFAVSLETLFGKCKDFSISIYDDENDPKVVASFSDDSFRIEIFAQRKVTTVQNAFRHMIVEYRVLCAMGGDFRKEVVELKKKGLKTEPAFAKMLELAGDPYEAVLALWR